MAYEILSESYGARLPKITATADSTDDLVTMGTNYAEGSTCVIGDKTYALDKVHGWVEPGSGGGGGGLLVHVAHEEGGAEFTCDKTWEEIKDVVDVGGAVYFDIENYDGSVYMVSLSYINGDSGTFRVYTTQSDFTFTTTSEDGYPSAYWD